MTEMHIFIVGNIFVVRVLHFSAFINLNALAEGYSSQFVCV